MKNYTQRERERHIEREVNKETEAKRDLIAKHKNKNKFIVTSVSGRWGAEMSLVVKECRTESGNVAMTTGLCRVTSCRLLVTGSTAGVGVATAVTKLDKQRINQ